MTRDEIMHLVNETAPKYEPFGCEAHFQNFARRLIDIEREACAKVADAWAMWPGWCDVAKDIAHEIRRRGDV
jgi:hypothetical protein